MGRFRVQDHCDGFSAVGFLCAQVLVAGVLLNREHLLQYYMIRFSTVDMNVSKLCAKTKRVSWL